MNDLLLRSGIKLDEQGYIKIPSWVKRVKIDIGLSDGAPQAAKWLEKEPDDLLIFGFEPNQNNTKAIRTRDSNWSITIHPKHLGTRFYLIECALSDVAKKTITPFYYTANDPGCSSLLQPKEFPVAEVVNVETWSLNHFLRHFPFHQIPYIDYIKTDCQGADLQVIKGCSDFLDKVAIFTCEADDTRYHESLNTHEALAAIFKTHGFIEYKPYMKNLSKFIGPRLKYIHTEDPTFINSKLRKEIATRKIRAFQEG